MTVSSIEVPKPSLRISTPKSLAEAAAPYSLAPAMVMSKGRIWSLYQGRAGSSAHLHLYRGAPGLFFLS